MRGLTPLALSSALLLALTGCPDSPSPNDAGGDSAVDAPMSYHDPLSAPAEPTLTPSSFSGASACKDCHPGQYAEWRSSMHAYSMVDPVYRQLVRLRQTAFDGAQDQFCLQCHSAIATRGGEIVPNFAFEDLSPIALEGITCESCHRVASIARPYNSGHVLDPDGPIRGPLRNPDVSVYHESEYSPMFESSEFCGACHDVREANGVPLERPYQEWVESPAQTAGPTCQGCHMPTYRGATVPGGTERDLHRHRFVGLDLPLSPNFISPDDEAAMATEIRDLLGTAASLEIHAQSRQPGTRLDTLVTVHNLINGHNLPTGSTFLRQIWIEVIAQDALGRVLYETGTLDANGDLRDRYSALDPYGDSDLVSLGSRLLDAHGEPTVLSWEAAEHVSSTIPALQARTFTFFVPTAADTTGPVTITARLRLRTHPPFLLRLLELDELIDRVQTYDLASATVDVDLSPP